MASPQKRSRRPPTSSSARLAEASLPLHLALAYILVRVYPIGPNREPFNLYSATFRASILELVARELYELTDTPATYLALRDDVEKLLVPQKSAIGRYNDKVRSRGHPVSEEMVEAENQASWMEIFRESFETVPDGCTFLDNLEKEIRGRVNEDDEVDLTEVPEPIERRSPVGLFLRGILLALRKLSFDETAHLSVQVGQWCGVTHAGPSVTRLWSLNRKLAMEDTLEKRVAAMQSYKAASNSGDYSAALSSLRRFYDYQFPSSSRGRHQHALLNLAAFHYSSGGLASAKEAVEEAIRVARAEGDRSCLRHCISLLHRINAESITFAFEPGEDIRIEAKQIPIARVPKAASPLDELWSLNTALDLGEPVHVAVRRVHLALNRHESTNVKADDRREPQSGWTTDYPFEEGAWHASQAGLWSMIGSTSMTVIHEDLTMTSAGVNEDAMLTVMLARAERLTNAGDFDGALGSLSDFTVLDKMSIESYRRWSRLVWVILRRQATLQDDHETLDMIDALDGGDSSRRSGPGGPMRQTDEDGDERTGGILLVPEEIRSSLKKARKLKDANSPPHLVLPHILSSIRLSTQLGYWLLYRMGIVFFTEVLLSMGASGMAHKALGEIEKIWPAMSDSGDEEIIARAQLVMGKAKIEITLDGGSGDFRSASYHLECALVSATKIQSRTLITECLTLLGLVSEAKGDTVGAEKYSRNWRDTEFGAQRSGKLTETVRRIGEIVKLVGVRVAEGWS